MALSTELYFLVSFTLADIGIVSLVKFLGSRKIIDGHTLIAVHLPRKPDFGRFFVYPRSPSSLPRARADLSPALVRS